MNESTPSHESEGDNTSSPFGPVIHTYTRQQAIDDGVLVDLTPWAAELGFVYPVACIRTVWDRFVTPPQAVAEGHGQSPRGRGHDLLWMLLLAIRRSQPDEPADRIRFEVLFLQRAGEQPEPVTMFAHCGPGDAGEPVITVMLPGVD